MTVATYTNPFFYSPAAGIFPSPEDRRTVHQKMVQLGLNTGNMMFASALQTVLEPAQGCRWATRPGEMNIDQIRAEHDCVVIAAANWLQPRTDFTDLATKLEAIGLPTFLIGLGAQAGGLTSKLELTEGTKRLLGYVSHNSAKMAVRGHYTAEVLKELGIDNIEATGCPSMLVAPDSKIEKPARAPSRIAIAGSRGLPNDRILTARHVSHTLSRRLMQVTLDQPLEFIMQAEMPEIDVLLSGGDYSHISPEWITFLEEYYRAPFADILPAIMNKMKVFLNIPDWITYLQSVDFVVGTRLHGTIAALIAQTPTLLITHDSRTAEMAEIMALPAISSAEIDPDNLDFNALYEHVDMDRYTQGLKAYKSRYIRFFEENGLAHHVKG